MHYKLIFASLVAFTGTFSSVWAQQTEENVNSQQIQVMRTGRILDALTDEPIPAAVIYTPDKLFSAMADEQGRFQLHLPDTVSVLQCSALDYEVLNIALKDFSTAEMLIRLSPDAEVSRLNDVKVIGRRHTTSISTQGAAKVERIGIGELMKAACCNLSESFETTPSVDVGFTDAVSGYKQIQMLGLAGTYTSFTRENIPDIRGLAAITGLTFTPGTFVESMQLSKGAGSVVNGFEGTAGQINVEWLKPFEAATPKLLLNGYQSTQGRSEANVIYSHSINEHLSTNLFLHGRSDWSKVDMNNDGFLDNPLGENFVVANRWFYFGDNGWEFQAGVKGVSLNTLGGEETYTRGLAQIPGNAWGYQNQVKRLESWAKIGKIFPHKPYKSMGLQLSAIFHEQDNQYGPRDYNAHQNSYYLNFITQTIIGNTNNVIKYGLSAVVDDIEERYTGTLLRRSEVVPGAFAEYAYSWAEKINVVAGLRADYNNLFGAFVTPRLHMRYAPNEQTALRASIGRAQRTANALAENTGLMATGRRFYFNNVPLADLGSSEYPFKPEVAWNMGVNLTRKFILNYRDGTFGVDYYYTRFSNQVVVDIEQYNAVHFYNLAGRSFSHSLQFQLDYEPIRFFDVRLAYRFYDVRSSYGNELLAKPLVARHRAFANLAYSTRSQWKFDYTVQRIGAKRLPQHFDHGGAVVASTQTPAFWLMNAQISKSFKSNTYQVYAGIENILNEMQMPMIFGTHDPYGEHFDASLIWGSGMGRNIYLGFRINLGKAHIEHPEASAP